MTNKITHVAAFAIALVLGLAVSASSVTPVVAASVIERGIWQSGPRYDAALPDCASALPEIANQFASKESGYWNSALEILRFDHIREVALMPWSATQAIPRRFCSARALLNDGRARTVHYSIVEDGGFASFGSGVEWCVVGLDRNWANNPRCRAARP